MDLQPIQHISNLGVQDLIHEEDVRLLINFIRNEYPSATDEHIAHYFKSLVQIIVQISVRNDGVVEIFDVHPITRQKIVRKITLRPILQSINPHNS